MFYSSFRHRIHYYYKMMIPVWLPYGPCVVPTTWTQMRCDSNKIDRKTEYIHLEAIGLWILWVLLNASCHSWTTMSCQPQKGRRERCCRRLWWWWKDGLQNDTKSRWQRKICENGCVCVCNLINDSWKNREHDKKRACNDEMASQLDFAYSRSKKFNSPKKRADDEVCYLSVLCHYFQ